MRFCGSFPTARQISISRILEGVIERKSMTFMVGVPVGGGEVEVESPVILKMSCVRSVAPLPSRPPLLAYPDWTMAALMRSFIGHGQRGVFVSVPLTYRYLSQAPKAERLVAAFCRRPPPANWLVLLLPDSVVFVALD